jgi:hypothetical protein
VRPGVRDTVIVLITLAALGALFALLVVLQGG